MVDLYHPKIRRSCWFNPEPLGVSFIRVRDDLYNLDEYLDSVLVGL